jgi:O-antigen/teichoic acid export membrane protein
MTSTDEQQAPPRSLGSSVTRALGWSTLAQILGRVFNLGVGLVLARLLTKEDFGVYAVALVAINLLIVVNDLGIISAIIRWQGDVRKVAGTAATVSLVFSAFVFAAAFAAAPAFAEAMGSPEATNMVRVIAVAILVDGWSAVPQAVIVREFRNDRLALAELGGFFAGVPVTIGLALAGAGPWSIVAGRVVTAVVVAAIVFISAPFRVRPSFDGADAVALVRFGAPLALSAVVAQAVLNVDYIVVGRTLGAEDLGVYLLAFNLSSWPANIITTAVARVAFAGFSRLAEDRSRLATAIPRAIGVAIAVLVPMVTTLAVLAPEVIEFLYGKKWAPAATPLRFLLILGGMRIVMDLLVDLTIADGRPRTALAVRSVWLVAVVPALAVGAEADGLRGVGVAHVLVAGVVVLPLLLLDARRSGVRPVDLGRQAVRPLLSGAAATAAAVAAVPLVPGVVPRLVVAGAAGGVAYLVTFVPRNPLVTWVADRVRPGRRARTGPAEES